MNAPPAKKITDIFWDQCQHGTWFFPPWHRGYLVALENILRSIIVKKFNGPAAWALPYWNYLKQSSNYAEYKIPPAFTQKTLPDGSTNPLYVPERYGPNGDGNAFVEVGMDINTDANDECQWDPIYSNPRDPKQDPPTPPNQPGNIYGDHYGGAQTGFSHGNGGFGDLEMNPHNFVHGMVGGNNANGQSGLMGVPATAALDPVFYLHHANIDRMWAAWNVTGKNNNPVSANWLSGPTAHGNSRFAMPLDAKATPWYYTPQDVQSTATLKYNGATYAYTYDDLTLTSYDKTPPKNLPKSLTERLTTFGVKDTSKINLMTHKDKTELVGATGGSLSLKSGETITNIKLDNATWKMVSESMLKASTSSLPDRVYLLLEGVKGANDTNFLSVYVNQKFVKTISLFGLHAASLTEGSHGGAGLTYQFDITNIVDDMQLNQKINVSSLEIEIKTKKPIPEGSKITVDRIGVYRRGQ